MDDNEILDLYFARSEQAIVQTDQKYGFYCYSIAKRILSDPLDAEESVNDTYAEVWKSIPPRRPKYFFAFLASICRHLSLNRVDWKQAAKRRAQVVPLTEEMENCIPDTVHERQMEAKELGKLLDLFLESLPKDSRLIFLRRYWYVDSVQDIAARYALRENTAKSILFRTREKLRRYLAGEGIIV